MEKIIHYFYDDIDIWKKNDSNTFRICYFSWKKNCPDYEIKLWHTKMPEFEEMLASSRFLRECYKRKMWAFVSDYVRYWVLYNYGGIYLDTDVQLLKNFDEYLDKPFFCSIEGDILRGENVPEPAVMGGEKENLIFERALEIYNSNEIFNIDYPIANVVLSKILKEITGFSRIEYTNEENAKNAEKYYDKDIFPAKIKDYELYKKQKIFIQSGINIYPSEYFCPTWDTFGEKAITDNTVAIHWNQSSWWKDKKRLIEIESMRCKNPLQRFLYKNSEKIAKIGTFFIPIKDYRRNLRKNVITYLKVKGV